MVWVIFLFFLLVSGKEPTLKDYEENGWFD